MGRNEEAAHQRKDSLDGQRVPLWYPTQKMGCLVTDYASLFETSDFVFTLLLFVILLFSRPIFTRPIFTRPIFTRPIFTLLAVVLVIRDRYI